MTSIAMAGGRLREWIGRLLHSSGPLPPLSWRGQVFDVFLALCLGITALIEGNDEPDGPARIEPYDPYDPPIPVPELPRLPDGEPFLPIEQEQVVATSALFLLVVLPLVFRRRHPLLVLMVVLATALAVNENDAALRLSFYACVIAGYTAAVYSPYRIPALAALPVAALLYMQIRESAVPTVPEDAVPFLILVPIAIAADGLRRWRRRADEHRTQLSILEREQAEALRRAAEHERARIARELHDVVTHNVSMMVIQAGAARTVLPSDPRAAQEALLAVEAGGRAAMAELRHVMGLLTMDAPDSDGLSPQPDLDGLEALVQRVCDAGTPVTLTVTGDRRRLPPGVELAAFRVVQEGLTNTMKHAVGANAAVTVHYGPSALTVEVTDTGGAPGAPTGGGNGHGLLGLRERLAVYGGTLEAGRRLTGGFRIAAHIPVEDQ